MFLNEIIAITIDGQPINLNEVLRYAKNNQAFSVLQNKARQRGEMVYYK